LSSCKYQRASCDRVEDIYVNSKRPALEYQQQWQFSVLWHCDVSSSGER
jgi:hypothetical protein